MKKLTEEQLHQLNVDIETAIKENKTWRRGQAHFNVLYAQYPFIANKIRSTSIDPFYNDLLIASFWSYLMDHCYMH